MFKRYCPYEYEMFFGLQHMAQGTETNCKEEDGGCQIVIIISTKAPATIDEGGGVILYYISHLYIAYLPKIIYQVRVYCLGILRV